MTYTFSRFKTNNANPATDIDIQRCHTLTACVKSRLLGCRVRLATSYPPEPHDLKRLCMIAQWLTADVMLSFVTAKGSRLRFATVRATANDVVGVLT